MPMPDSPLKIGFNVPFSEAIKAAQQRGVVLPDVYYGVLQGLARQQAFSIAGLASLDQLTIVRDSLAAKLQNGQTFRQWQKDILESGTLDLPQHRLDNIFRTNIQSNYNRGRWERFVEVKATRPYLMYDAINDSRVRPTHLAMDSIIRPVGDTFWNTHAPLNGYRCRCRLISLSEGQAQARSGADTKNQTYYGPEGQEIPQVQGGHGLNKVIDEEGMKPDKGFDYNPGEDLLAGVNQGIESRRVTAPVKLVRALNTKLANPSTYWQAGTQQASWHDASFANSPDWIKEAIKKHDGDFKGLLPINPNAGAYQTGNKIHMAQRDMASYTNQGTWRHEYGHYLDQKNKDAGYRLRSTSIDFTQAMEGDSKKILEASGYGRKSAKADALNANRTQKINDLRANIGAFTDLERKSYLSGRAKKIGLSLDDVESFFVKETVHIDDNVIRDYRIAYLIEAIENKDATLFMTAIDGAGADKRLNYSKGLIGKFSDTVGSATKNKLLGHGPHGNGGHSNEYYKKLKGYGQQTEVFANLTCLLGSESKIWVTAVESFYPSLTTLFKDILK